MRYLLDVNALIALGYVHHEFHGRVKAWAKGRKLCTSSISELGFIRILSGLPEAEITVETCRKLLVALKKEWNIGFVSDDCSAVNLPEWVRRSKQTTDGHLASLARSKSLRLATLDEDIPGAFLIPAPRETNP